MDELTISDKIYISSKRAAEITGYAKDYIGQLCREGRVEATLVGRSWYVLESSLRAHRFGSSEEESGAEKAKNGTGSEPFTTWNAPSYVSETSPDMAPLERRSVNVLESEGKTPANAEIQPASIEDMQSAWKEWFASRKEPQEALLETPEIVDAREAQYEPVEPVSIAEEEVQEQREVETLPAYDPVPSTPETEEPVAIHRAQEAYVAPVPVAIVRETRTEVTRPQKRARRRQKGSYLAVRALLISVTVLAIAVAAVGAGFADAFATRNGIEYAPLRFLGGTSLLDK